MVRGYLSGGMILISTWTGISDNITIALNTIFKSNGAYPINNTCNTYIRDSLQKELSLFTVILDPIPVSWYAEYFPMILYIDCIIGFSRKTTVIIMNSNNIVLELFLSSVLIYWGRSLLVTGYQKYLHSRSSFLLSQAVLFRTFPDILSWYIHNENG